MWIPFFRNLQAFQSFTEIGLFCMDNHEQVILFVASWRKLPNHNVS